MGFICLKVAEPLQDSLLYGPKSADIPGTHFIDLGRMKTESILKPPSDFEPQNSRLGIQRLID